MEPVDVGDEQLARVGAQAGGGVETLDLLRLEDRAVRVEPRDPLAVRLGYDTELLGLEPDAALGSCLQLGQRRPVLSLVPDSEPVPRTMSVAGHGMDRSWCLVGAATLYSDLDLIPRSADTRRPGSPARNRRRW